MEDAKQKDRVQGSRSRVVRFARVSSSHLHSIPFLQKFGGKRGRSISINFVLLRSPLLTALTLMTPKPWSCAVSTDSYAACFKRINSIMRQRNSVPVRPLQKYFGTLAVTRIVHVSPSRRIPISICVSLQRRVHIRQCFNITHFKTQAEN
jgi:hypothetical protein